MTLQCGVTCVLRGRCSTWVVISDYFRLCAQTHAHTMSNRGVDQAARHRNSRTCIHYGIIKSNQIKTPFPNDTEV